jgi:hypothetical protein
LIGAGFISDLILRKISKFSYRIALLIGILIVLFLIWAELAVGIFGTPFAGT